MTAATERLLHVATEALQIPLGDLGFGLGIERRTAPQSYTLLEVGNSHELLFGPSCHLACIQDLTLDLTSSALPPGQDVQPLKGVGVSLGPRAHRVLCQ